LNLVDTDTAKTPFFIFFYERSGSTLLIKLLDQHPEIRCFPEVFHLNWGSSVQSDRGKPIYKSEEEIRQQLERIYKTPKEKACGFKFKYPGQFKKYHIVSDYLKSQKDSIKLIFLYRKNKLKGAISKQNQLKLKEMNGNSNISINSSVNLPPFQLHIQSAIRYATRREKQDRYFHRKSNIFKYRYVISYEDLAQNPIEETQKIFNFLGVDDSFPPTIATKKLTNNSIKKAITNYGLLKKRLRCHPLEVYLD